MTPTELLDKKIKDESYRQARLIVHEKTQHLDQWIRSYNLHYFSRKDSDGNNSSVDESMSTLFELLVHGLSNRLQELAIDRLKEDLFK